MVNKLLILKISKYATVILGLILGILGFTQILPMPFVIPVTIILFLACIVIDAFEMHCKKVKSHIEKFSYFLRVGFVVIPLIIMIIVVIKEFVIKR